jgi:hypothetical protein
MKSWLQKNYLSVIGIFVGAITGYFYWKEVGCASGTCMISSKPLNSTLYFAVLGFLVFSMFKKEKTDVK